MKIGIVFLAIVIVLTGCKVSDSSVSKESGSASKKNPKLAFHLKSAEQYILAKRIVEAREEYLQAEALEKNEPEVWQGIALTNYYLGDYAKSILYWEKIFQTSPDSLLALFYMGKSYLELKKPEQALGCFEKAKAIQASSAVEYHLGLCYKAMKNQEKEASCYEAALIMSPENRNLRWTLATLYQNLRAWDKAQKHFEEIERQEASFSHKLPYHLAKIYIEQGKIDEAKKQIQKYAMLEPEKEMVEDLQIELQEKEYKIQRQLAQDTEKQNMLKELEECNSLEELESRIYLSAGRLNKSEIHSMGIYDRILQKEKEIKEKK